jgi:hypothetical protein
MMIDPERRPHAARRMRAEQQPHAPARRPWARSAAASAPPIAKIAPASAASAPRDRHLFGHRAAHERPQHQHDARDRQVDDPRPVDVGAIRRIEPILAEVEPVLAGKMSARTCIIRRLSSVSPSANHWMRFQRSVEEQGARDPEDERPSRRQCRSNQFVSPPPRHPAFALFNPLSGH